MTQELMRAICAQISAPDDFVSPDPRQKVGHKTNLDGTTTRNMRTACDSPNQLQVGQLQACYPVGVGLQF